MSRPGYLFEKIEDFGSTDPEQGPGRDMTRLDWDQTENSNSSSQWYDIQMSRPGYAYVPIGTCI